MILQWKDGAVSLVAPGDFKSFKVVVEGGAVRRGDVLSAFQGIAEFVDDRTAWVSQEALRQWRSQRGDPQWQKGLDAMIAKARPYGWIHEASGAIKAHVEWSDAAATT
jgi:hypothetical protein